MLELTLTTGTELKIGDDIRILFRTESTVGRVKVAVEAPKEKRIERVKPLAKQEKKSGVFIVGNVGRAAVHHEKSAKTGNS